MDFASVSSESAPDAATIRLAFRLRSDSVKTPGPITGHILSLIYILLSRPSTSFQNRTLHQLPLIEILPVWPLRRLMERPLRRFSGVAACTVSLFPRGCIWGCEF